MGTEVLYPRDYLMDHLKVPVMLARKKLAVGNPNSLWRSGRKPAVKTESVSQKKRFEKETVNGKFQSCRKQEAGKNLVMGQVTILKRPQSLDCSKNQEFVSKDAAKPNLFDEDLVVCGTERLGPDPALVLKQIRLTDLKAVLSPVLRSDVYAGSAFSLSPSPKSLPLPNFSKKKGFEIVEDSATKDLRRLLRLD